MSEYIAEYLYDLLGKKYIEFNDITINNIGDKFTQANEMKTIINDMLSYNISNNLKVYFVKGYNWEFKTSTKKDINIMIAVNEENNCFSVYPSEYIQQLQLNEVTVGEQLDIKEENFIVVKNQKNTYNKKNISIATLIQEYVDLYKFNVNYDKEAAYESLNEEYKNNKFGNLEDYKKYLKNNLTTIKIDQYSTYYGKNITQYVCTTNNEGYFIINETAPMKYSIILDAYTVDLPAFVDEYNDSSNTTKVALNIEKIKMAINEKDYQYVYNKLNETFKENNYPTLEILSNYIKNNFFDNNIFTCENIEKQNTAYIFTIKVTSSDDENSEEKSINVIMRLLEGTNFEMSFGEN